MRLLVVSQFFWPEDFRINDLVAELSARGHSVTVLTGGAPNYPDGRVFAEFTHDPGAFMQYAGADIVRVPLVPRGEGRLGLLVNFASFALSASLLGAWKLRGRRFDAVFVFMVTPATVGIPAVVLAALKRAPLTAWVLDSWPECLEAFGAVRSPVLLDVVGKLMSLMYRRCALLLAPSRTVIPQIATHCKDPSRIIYFPSWAEPIFRAGNEVPAPEIPVRPGTFDVMFAGNIGEAQDFPAILDAAELLKCNPQIRWLLVGGGRMVGWVQREIERRHLQNCMLMLGRHPVERMPSFYQHADALLVSLRDEPIFSMTIPSKLQSYFAAGVPVVGMLNGECADVIERSSAGLTCRASDSKGLAAAVLRLAALPDEARAEMRKNALSAYATEFDRKTLISRLETWLEELRHGILQRPA